MTCNILSSVTKRMSSRSRIWTRINQCSFWPCASPSVKAVNPFPPQAVRVPKPVLNAAVRLPSVPAPTAPVLPVWFTTRFISSPVFLFFLFAIRMMRAQLASSLILSCDRHHPCLEKFLLLPVSHLAWHQSWKRLPMTRWTFPACELCNGANDFISV